jgi:hypothetical protein
VQGSPPKAAATLPKSVDRQALQAKIDALTVLLEKLERHYLS